MIKDANEMDNLNLNKNINVNVIVTRRIKISVPRKYVHTFGFIVCY